jgi:hypothetical protein
MDKIDSNIKISGAIGIKILYNSLINKKIFIFYDDHSNTNYCKFDNFKSKTNLFISELFNEIIDKDIAMILEEPFIESNSKIKILWENSEHLILFRKFYTKLMDKCSNKKICKLFPIDIRLSIFEISPDEIIFNLTEPRQEYNIILNKYFHNIHYLFDLNKSNEQVNKICLFIKKVFDVYKTSDFYKFLKEKIINFTEKYNIYTSNETIYEIIKQNSHLSNFVYEEGYPYSSKHKDNFIDEMDKISSAIMELYSLILILLLGNKNIIFFAGYYHSNNIAHILQKYYNFNLEFSSGTTDNIHKTNSKKIKNCIKINKKHFKFIQ